MNHIQIMGSLAVAFGILVIIFPSLVGYLVGIFFVVIGVNILAFGRNFPQIKK